MNPAKVSILIPVYNREKFIAECIQSALDQTYTDFEVVVVDNDSDDGTWEICQRFAALDQRVRVFRNETNIGPVRNWLACVEKARGEYSKILWSDDLIHPEFLGRLLPYLDDPLVGFVYSQAVVFENAKERASTMLLPRMATGIYDSQIFVEGMLIEGGFPYSPGCAIFRTGDVKKNLLLHVPNRVGSDFSMHAIGNDMLLFLLTAKEYPKFAAINLPLAYFRTHKGSITKSAPPGKIPLHYDLAKGYFAEKYVFDTRILKRLNTRFLMHLLKYKTRELGIVRVSDFYPTVRGQGIDVLFLMGLILRRIWIESVSCCKSGGG